MPKSLPKFILALVFSAYLISSCQSPIIQFRATPTPTGTPTNSPTSTLTFTPAPTGTATPTDTPAPTITLTPTQLIYAQEGTPLPVTLPLINTGDAWLVSGLASMRERNVTSLKWKPGGGQLAVGTLGGIALYDPWLHERTQFILTGDGLRSFDFDPSGNWLVTGHSYGSDKQGYAGNLQVWAAPKYPLFAAYGDDRPISAVSYLPGGKILAAAYTSLDYDQNAIEFRDTYTWEITGTLKTGPVLDMAFSPAGGLLAVSPDQYAVKIWDMNEGTLMYTFFTSFTGAVNCLAFSPDGAYLATGHYDGAIRLWELGQGTLVKTLNTNGVVESIGFSPDSQLLAVGTSYTQHLIELWSVSDGALLRTLEGHQNGVDQLAFSNLGNLIASASYDGEVRLWGIRP
jgi:WD40 repeat protein